MGERRTEIEKYEGTYNFLTNVTKYHVFSEALFLMTIC